MKLQNLQAEITHQGENVTIQFTIPSASFISFINSLKQAKKPTLTVAAVVDPKEAENRLFALVKAFQDGNPGKYPRSIYISFMKWWSEPSKTGRLRYEKEPFFEVGRRLATFWAKVTPEEKNKMWEQHHANTSVPTLFKSAV